MYHHNVNDSKRDMKVDNYCTHANIFIRSRTFRAVKATDHFLLFYANLTVCSYLSSLLPYLYPLESVSALVSTLICICINKTLFTTHVFHFDFKLLPFQTMSQVVKERKNTFNPINGGYKIHFPILSFIHCFYSNSTAKCLKQKAKVLSCGKNKPVSGGCHQNETAA